MRHADLHRPLGIAAFLAFLLLSIVTFGAADSARAAPLPSAPSTVGALPVHQANTNGESSQSRLVHRAGYVSRFLGQNAIPLARPLGGVHQSALLTLVVSGALAVSLGLICGLWRHLFPTPANRRHF